MKKIEERSLQVLPKLQLLPKVLLAIHPRQMELVGMNSCQVDADSAHLAVLDMFNPLPLLYILTIRKVTTATTLTTITIKRESHVNISFAVTVRLVIVAIFLMRNSCFSATCRIGYIVWNYCRIIALLLIRSSSFLCALLVGNGTAVLLARTLLCIYNNIFLRLIVSINGTLLVTYNQR